MVVSNAEAGEWSTRIAPQQELIRQPRRCILKLISFYGGEDSIILIDLQHIKYKYFFWSSNIVPETREREQDFILKVQKCTSLGI